MYFKHTKWNINCILKSWNVLACQWTNGTQVSIHWMCTIIIVQNVQKSCYYHKCQNR